MTFEDLGLCPQILAALKEEGYEKPSPIQEQAIPPALAGRDVLGCAQTGTRKNLCLCRPDSPAVEQQACIRAPHPCSHPHSHPGVGHPNR